MEQRQSQQTARRRLLSGAILTAILVTATAVAVQWQEPADSAVDAPAAAPQLESRGTPPSQQTAFAPPSSDAERSDQKQPPLAEQLVGVWRLQKHGERTLQVNADGTATVRANLNMLGALMYGEQLTLQLEWTLDGDVMTQTISSGTPPKAVQRLVRDWGDRREYRVVEVNDDQLVLSELGDDGDRDVWTSAGESPSSTASQTTQSPR